MGWFDSLPRRDKQLVKNCTKTSVLSWFCVGSEPTTRHHVRPDEPENHVHLLPDRESCLGRAACDHLGDLRRVSVPAAVHGERLVRLVRLGSLPGSGAAGGAAAVLRPDAAAGDAAGDDAAGGFSGLPAESSSPERQQPGVRPGAAAERPAGGERAGANGQNS